MSQIVDASAPAQCDTLEERQTHEVRLRMSRDDAFAFVRDHGADAIVNHSSLVHSIDTIHREEVSNTQTNFVRIWHIDVPLPFGTSLWVPSVVRESLLTFRDDAQWFEDSRRCHFVCTPGCIGASHETDVSPWLELVGDVSFDCPNKDKDKPHQEDECVVVSRVSINTRASAIAASVPIVGSMLAIVVDVTKELIRQVIAALLRSAATSSTAGQ